MSDAKQQEKEHRTPYCFRTKRRVDNARIEEEIRFNTLAELKEYMLYYRQKEAVEVLHAGADADSVVNITARSAQLDTLYSQSTYFQSIVPVEAKKPELLKNPLPAPEPVKAEPFGIVHRSEIVKMQEELLRQQTHGWNKTLKMLLAASIPPGVVPQELTMCFESGILGGSRDPAEEAHHRCTLPLGHAGKHRNVSGGTWGCVVCGKGNCQEDHAGRAKKEQEVKQRSGTRPKENVQIKAENLRLSEMYRGFSTLDLPVPIFHVPLPITHRDFYVPEAEAKKFLENDSCVLVDVPGTNTMRAMILEQEPASPLIPDRMHTSIPKQEVTPPAPQQTPELDNTPLQWEDDGDQKKNYNVMVEIPFSTRMEETSRPSFGSININVRTGETSRPEEDTPLDSDTPQFIQSK